METAAHPNPGFRPIPAIAHGLTGGTIPEPSSHPLFATLDEAADRMLTTARAATGDRASPVAFDHRSPLDVHTRDESEGVGVAAEPPESDPASNESPPPEFRPPAPRGAVSNPHSVPVRAVAVIDVGSNAVRIVAISHGSDARRRTLFEDRVRTGLGVGLAGGTGLTDDAIEETAAAVRKFVKRAVASGCEPVCIFATAAVREAPNAETFCARVRDQTGLQVEVLSARDEGLMAFRGANLHTEARDTEALVDIGGGSGQIVLARRGVVITNVSLPLGALRLTERFGDVGPEALATFANLRNFVDETVRAAIPKWWTPIEEVVGCGGGFTSAAAIDTASRSAASPAIGSGAIESRTLLERASIGASMNRLRAMTPAERASFPGLPGDRARIAFAGLCVADRVMKHLGAKRARLSYAGVRGGLVDRLLEAANAAPSPLAGAERLADRCGDERSHSNHVRILALSLFDQLEAAGVTRLTSSHRDLLAIAATVHDVGVLAGYEKHHKSGRDIVLNQPIEGLTQRDNVVVSQIVRYHRKAGPSAAHEGFAALDAADADLVRLLCGILRIADGLDRTHTQTVHSARLHRFASEVRIVVTASGETEENLHAATLKADVLSHHLTAPIRIERLL